MTSKNHTNIRRMENSSLLIFYRQITNEFESYVSEKLDINMARGKPGSEQLDESLALLELPETSDYISEDGIDCRTYGGNIKGLSEARRLLAPLVGARPENVIVSGNSSIALIHDVLVYAFLHGLPDSKIPWSLEPTIRFLCPVPGYDFHFNLLSDYGIEMIPIPLSNTGPDVEVIETYAASDPIIKGLIGVPRFSNPTGDTYSKQTLQRLAKMPTAAKDFRLFLDNAYAVHHLTHNAPQLENIIDICSVMGSPDRAFVFSSTSKITFPGSGLAVLGSSRKNIKWFTSHFGRRSIGPDKINQLRHIRFLKDWKGINKLMALHAKHMAPKFKIIDSILTKSLENTNMATWSQPLGGYFISLYTTEGCASFVVDKAAKAGVTLTPSGAAFPNGHDPHNHHLRIAPSGLTLQQAEKAAKVVAASVKIIACEAELSERGLL